MDSVESIISRYKNRILNIAIIAVSLLTAFNIYKDQSKGINNLEKNKQKEIERNEILSTISKTDKKLRTYKAFMNKKDISLIIDNLGNLADSSGAKIVSVKPDPEQMYPLYVKYAFNLGIVVSDYNTLGKFINKLEKSDDVYVIEGLVILADYMSSKEADIKGLVVNMRVSTFLLRD